MSKGANGALPAKSILAFVLPLFLYALLVTTVACEDLSSDTLAATSSDDAAITIIGAIPTGVTQTSPTPESAPGPVPSSESTTTTSPPATTTTSLWMFETEMELEHVFIPAGWTRYEDTDSHLQWSGTWAQGSTSDASGGSHHTSNDATAKVTIKFNGTQIGLVSVKAPGMGYLKLTLDSWSPMNVDLYDSSPGTKTAWTSGVLASGVHTVMIEWTGLKNAASGNTWISVDAVDLKGTLVY
jgi:hypothetical protein